MSNVYVYINKQAGKTRWVWGNALPGNFQKLDALRLLTHLPHISTGRHGEQESGNHFHLEHQP